jgi:hypothetical protein
MISSINVEIIYIYIYIYIHTYIIHRKTGIIKTQNFPKLSIDSTQSQSKPQQKGWRCAAQWLSVCQACTRPWVQSPVLGRKKSSAKLFSGY